VLPADYVNKRLAGWNQRHAKDQDASRFGCNPWGRSDFLAGDAFLYGVGYIEVLDPQATLHPIGDYNAEWFFFWDSWVKSPFCGWNHDKQNQRFSFEFYLDNDQEENQPLVTYDDGAGWQLVGVGSGSANISGGEDTVNKIRGSSCFRIQISPTGGSYEWLAAIYNFPQTLDLSGYDFWCIWWYGSNSGKWNHFLLKTTGVDWFRWNVLDDWVGWRRLILPLRSPHESYGNVSLSQINLIQIDFYPIDIADRTHYIDRTLFDYARWVRCEVRVPDTLAYGSENQPDTWACRIKYWDAAEQTYKDTIIWNPYQASPAWRWSGDFKYLDGTKASQVNPYYGELHEAFTIGSRNTTGNPVFGKPITINYTPKYGCLRRIGFAFKLPPEDYRDTPTSGISQIKLKLEVKYAEEGSATYEFEDSTDQYYGLRNINKKYILLFRKDGQGPVDFIQLKNTTVGDGLPTYLAIKADHNEEIKEVQITLPNMADQSRKHWGQSTLDPTLDSNGDGILDVIEEVEGFVDQGGWG